jgi:hypothetical protein
MGALPSLSSAELMGTPQSHSKPSGDTFSFGFTEVQSPVVNANVEAQPVNTFTSQEIPAPASSQQEGEASKEGPQVCDHLLMCSAH